MIRRLITEQDVRAGRVASPLVLDAETLLTPAARDLAVRSGLVIVERGEPVPPGGPPAQGPPPRHPGPGGDGPAAGPVPPAPGDHDPLAAGAHTPLADGLYLVRVRGGRVEALHAATGPGLLRRRADR